MSYFSAEDLVKMRRARLEVKQMYANLMGRYIAHSFKSELGREYATQGFCRRLGTLARAVDQVFQILPPEREDIPERDEVVDATIAMQSFVFNTFGCLDNLAWVFVHEKEIRNKDGTELSRGQVGLGRRYKEIWRRFSPGFRSLVMSRKPWFETLKDFRDALAHRIPLYIPPYRVAPKDAEEHNRLERLKSEALRDGASGEFDRLDAEQMRLGLFRPCMTHSLSEEAGEIVFHSQLICDYLTVDEFGRGMLEELDRYGSESS